MYMLYNFKHGEVHGPGYPAFSPKLRPAPWGWDVSASTHQSLSLHETCKVLSLLTWNSLFPRILYLKTKNLCRKLDKNLQKKSRACTPHPLLTGGLRPSPPSRWVLNVWPQWCWLNWTVHFATPYKYIWSLEEHRYTIQQSIVFVHFLSRINLLMVMQQLGFGSMKPTTIFCDKQGAITMGLHPSNKPATRHIDMRKHFRGQHVELGNVTTPFKKTADMLADFLRKQTPKPTHERHRDNSFGDQTLGPALGKIQHVVQWFLLFDTNTVEEGWCNGQHQHAFVSCAMPP